MCDMKHEQVPVFFECEEHSKLLNIHEYDVVLLLQIVCLCELLELRTSYKGCI